MRLTFHMNKRLDRSGTLWEGRFKSVLVEDHERPCSRSRPTSTSTRSGPDSSRIRKTTAGAVMPRRSRRAERPAARDGLGRMLGEALDDPEYPKDWRRTAARYRMFLYQEGREVAADPESGQRGRRGFKEARSRRWSSGMSDVDVRGPASPSAVFLGWSRPRSAEFVNAVFAREHDQGGRFGEKRTSGARRMRGADWVVCACCATCARR